MSRRMMALVWVPLIAGCGAAGSMAPGGTAPGTEEPQEPPRPAPVTTEMDSVVVAEVIDGVPAEGEAPEPRVGETGAASAELLPADEEAGDSPHVVVAELTEAVPPPRAEDVAAPVAKVAPPPRPRKARPPARERRVKGRVSAARATKSAGGLGVVGTGRGGGGTGEGTIGLGSLGAVGHGSGGGGGSGVGYGRGSGSLRGRAARGRRSGSDSGGGSASSGGVEVARGAVMGTVPPAGFLSPSPATSPSPRGRRAVMSGPRAPVSRVLTAAVVSDADERNDYLSFLERHPGERRETGLNMTRRHRLRVVDGEDRPINDARLTLVGADFRVLGRTHADGVYDFYPGVAAPTAAGPMAVYVQVGTLTAAATVPVLGGGDSRDVTIRLPSVAAAAPRTLDLAFLVDVTGSMSDEFDYLRAEVSGIVRRVREATPGIRVRVAATLYRDRGDDVPLQQVPFTEDVERFVATLAHVRAEGGGDYPEDMDSGLAAALLTLDWSDAPAARALVLIADAPPQRYPEAQYHYHRAMVDAAARGIRLLPVAASGANRTVEYLFRALGAFTSTPYVYLTDDSGVGAPHLEADTDAITVEMFSDLLTRLLISDLRGEGMHPPAAPQVGLLVPAPGQ